MAGTHKVKVIELSGKKLDKNATHLIVVNGRSFTQETLSQLADSLATRHIDVVFALTNEEPKKAMHVYSIPKEKKDVKG